MLRKGVLSEITHNAQIHQLCLASLYSFPSSPGSPPSCLCTFASLPVNHVIFDPSHPSPEELKRQTAALEGAQTELSSIQDQLAQARSEIETIKAVATVSENTKQEAIDQVRSQWQEEVASLQAIMKGNPICSEKPPQSYTIIYQEHVIKYTTYYNYGVENLS